MKKQIWIISLIFCAQLVQAAATFEKTAFRYPSPFEVMDLLQAKFMYRPTNSLCYQVSDYNQDSLGVNQPGTGEPLNREPNQFFVTWFSACLSQYIGDVVQSGQGKQEFFSSLLPDEVMAVLPTKDFPNFLATPLEKMTVDKQRLIVEKVIRYFIGGPSIVRKYFQLSGRAGAGPESFVTFVNEIEKKVFKLRWSQDEGVKDLLKKFNITDLSATTLHQYLSLVILVVCSDDAFIRI